MTIFELWLADIMLKHPKEVREVSRLFPDPYEAYSECFATDSDYPTLSSKLLSDLRRKNLTAADKALRDAVRNDMLSVRLGDENYPALLSEIENPPYLLFVKGDVSLLSHPFSVTVVGTRGMTTVGKYSAFRLGYDLASFGASIVSGMALGIDSMAHAGALAAGGKTVAVFGCGLDVTYPKNHAVLKDRILSSGGLIVSEYFPGERPLGRNFPRRNRIMAGLSYSTVIVEASEDSGALITASEAVKEGRIAFAMPGYSYSAASIGSNKLIQSGIRTLTNAQTVAAEYEKVKNIKINLKDYRRITLERCDSFVEDLRIGTRVSDTSISHLKISPREVLGDGGDFPFAVKLEGNTRSGKAANEKRKDAEDAPAEKKVPSKESEANTEERSRDAGELERECESLGIELDGDMKYIISLIAECDTFSVDKLVKKGAKTDKTLQILTVLSSLALVEETSPSNYKVCKVTE